MSVASDAPAGATPRPRARIERAISSGVTAPMSRPAGNATAARRSWVDALGRTARVAAPRPCGASRRRRRSRPTRQRRRQGRLVALSLRGHHDVALRGRQRGEDRSRLTTQIGLGNLIVLLARRRDGDGKPQALPNRRARLPPGSHRRSAARAPADRLDEDVHACPGSGTCCARTPRRFGSGPAPRRAPTARPRAAPKPGAARPSRSASRAAFKHRGPRAATADPARRHGTRRADQRLGAGLGGGERHGAHDGGDGKRLDRLPSCLQFVDAGRAAAAWIDRRLEARQIGLERRQRSAGCAPGANRSTYGSAACMPRALGA